MTTIAYRDGVLAADTACVSGGTLLGSIVKIVRRADGAMAGAAGNATFVTTFNRWFVDGEIAMSPRAEQDEHSFDRGVIFRGGHSLEVFEPRGRFQATAPYFAFGSGKELALGAMFAGADAVTAVRAAIEHDPHTGGDITVLKHEG